MSRNLLLIVILLAGLSACQKNPKLGTVALDVYIHPESSSSDDVMLQTAIRGKLDADTLTSGVVQIRVVGLVAVLTGNVGKQAASDKAAQIAGSTKVTIDNDPALAAKSVQNMIKVGN
jgi:hypothetical protein